MDIFNFLHLKKQWIKKHLTDQKVKLRQRLIIADDHEITFFGQRRRIRVFQALRPRVELTNSSLRIYSRSDDPAELEKHFNKWLKLQASEYMTTQTIKMARKLGVGHKLKKVIFRKTKTKWGHCEHNGTIQYNWLTMMAPKPVVDYLIAHESSHLRHMDHSQKFWDTVASVCPDYENLKDWLSTYGHRFWTE